MSRLPVPPFTAATAAATVQAAEDAWNNRDPGSGRRSSTTSCASSSGSTTTFQYEWHDAGRQWWRSQASEMWQFDDGGYMSRREASINDVRIDEIDRRLG